MNRAQTQAIVDLWDDIDILAQQYKDIEFDQIDMIVREEGDDIESLTGECGWVEVTPMLFGSGPLLIMDPRGVIHAEREDSDGNMHAIPCKLITRVRKATGKFVLTSEDMNDNNGVN
jgi:hypothetical protein